MSTFSIFLGHSDIIVLQDLARHTEKSLNQSVNAKFNLHEIYSSIAHALNYPSWEVLRDFNINDVLFCDVFGVIVSFFPSCIKDLLSSKAGADVSIDVSEEIAKKILQGFFPKSEEWFKPWIDDIQGRAVFSIRLCLMPLNVPDHYEVIGFKNELDLLTSLERRTELDFVFGPVVQVNKNALSKRERPYAPVRPIFKYIEHFAKGAIFVENEKFKVCHFDYIDWKALQLSEDQLKTVMYRSVFFCPASYEFSFSLKGNNLFLNFHEEDKSKVIGKKKLTKFELEKVQMHIDERVAPVEFFFIYQALFFNKLEVDLSNPYLHFCKVQIASSEGFTIIS